MADHISISAPRGSSAPRTATLVLDLDHCSLPGGDAYGLGTIPFFDTLPNAQKRAADILQLLINPEALRVYKELCNRYGGRVKVVIYTAREDIATMPWNSKWKLRDLSHHYAFPGNVSAEDVVDQSKELTAPERATTNLRRNFAVRDAMRAFLGLDYTPWMVFVAFVGKNAVQMLAALGEPTGDVYFYDDNEYMLKQPGFILVPEYKYIKNDRRAEELRALLNRKYPIDSLHPYAIKILKTNDEKSSLITMPDGTLEYDLHIEPGGATPYPAWPLPNKFLVRINAERWGMGLRELDEKGARTQIEAAETEELRQEAAAERERLRQEEAAFDEEQDRGLRDAALRSCTVSSPACYGPLWAAHS